MTGTTKLYLVMSGIVLVVLTASHWFTYNKGGNDREAEMLVAYATAKPKINTVRTVEYLEKPKHRDSRVAGLTPDPRVDSLIHLLDVRNELQDSVIALLDQNNADKDSLIRELSSKASTTFTNPELGVLKVEYLPLDRLFTIDHQPPPAKIERVTVTIERPVLVRETFLEKLPTYALVAASSALVTIWTMKLAQ